MQNKQKTNSLSLVFKTLLICLLINPFFNVFSSESSALQSQLEVLIKKAKNKGLDVSREQMTLDTSRIFLKWADVDEQNVSTTIKHYQKHPQYKKNAEALAKALPDFERRSVVELLTHSINELQSVVAGKIVRAPIRALDYKKIVVKEGQFQIDDKPVFVSDYTWKKASPEINRYFGDIKSAYLAPSFITSDKGQINNKHLNKIKQMNSQQIGQTFISHNSIPKWITKKHPEITTGKRHYGVYDIDHPQAKELYQTLFQHFVPAVKGKRTTELGYMLFNEPSFFTQKGVWNSGGVSDYTHKKFTTWLMSNHSSIANLNALWGTTFDSFNQVKIDIPMDGALQGSAIWYDWMRFNQVRVSNWMQFLKNGIRKFDKNAKTHIKLMPPLWYNSSRDHGMDFETLLEQGDIVGFDAKAEYSHTRGKEFSWMEKYSYNWQNTIMTFDFFSSVQPQQLFWDSENHFVTRVAFQEKDTDTNYLESMYWFATTHGLSGALTWLWGRNPDGTVINRGKPDSAFVSGITHQPKGLHAITRTFMELNAHADDIIKFQKPHKPIRLFYSETSAINDTNYMTSVQENYEAMFFEGMPLGFATKNIINKHNSDNWKVIVIKDTPHVTLSELNALQKYLNNGGVILLDKHSLTKSEYGLSHKTRLKAANGKLLRLPESESLVNKINALAVKEQYSPKVYVSEKNPSAHKTVAWRLIETSPSSYKLSLVNTGKYPARVKVHIPGQNIRINNAFTQEVMSSDFDMPVRDMQFINVTVL